jgi:hypothetical protein
MRHGRQQVAENMLLLCLPHHEGRVGDVLSVRINLGLELFSRRDGGSIKETIELGAPKGNNHLHLPYGVIAAHKFFRDVHQRDGRQSRAGGCHGWNLKKKSICLWSRLWIPCKTNWMENELVIYMDPGVSLYMHTNQDYKRYVLAI